MGVQGMPTFQGRKIHRVLRDYSFKRGKQIQLRNYPRQVDLGLAHPFLAYDTKWANCKSAAFFHFQIQKIATILEVILQSKNLEGYEQLALTILIRKTISSPTLTSFTELVEQTQIVQYVHFIFEHLKN